MCTIVGDGRKVVARAGIRPGTDVVDPMAVRHRRRQLLVLGGFSAVPESLKQRSLAESGTAAAGSVV
jgi:hypothetical protein